MALLPINAMLRAPAGCFPNRQGQRSGDV